MSTARPPTSISCSRASCIASREITFPGLLASNQSNSNSRADKSSGCRSSCGAQRRALKGQATHLNPLGVAPFTLGSPQQRLQARDEDARACRLGDVGVGAEPSPST